MGKVRVEILSWLTETMSVEGTSDEITIDQEIEGDKTVRDLLNRLVGRYPRFGQIAFDVKGQRLTDRVSIFFNGRNLELVNGLETRLSDGDTLTLVPPIEGG